MAGVHDWRYIENHLVAHFWLTEEKSLCHRAYRNGAVLLSAERRRKCTTCEKLLKPWHTTPPYRRSAHDLAVTAASAMADKLAKLQHIIAQTAPQRRAEAYWISVVTAYNAAYHTRHTPIAIKEFAHRHKLSANTANSTVFVQLAYGFVCECGDTLPYNAVTDGSTVERWLNAHAEHQRRYHKNS